MTPLDLRRPPSGVVRVAHRGGAALAPENTLQAITAAAGVGIDAVELDVLRGGDGALVLAHGPSVPADAPLLADALDLVRSLGIAVQIDVKVPGNEAAIVEALHRHGLTGRAFVSAASLSILAAFAAVEPALPRSVTYPDDRHRATERRLIRPAVQPALAVLRRLAPVRLARLLRLADARSATLNWAVASPAAIAACHACSAAAYAWTVNEPARAITLVETGIDGIITDDPRIFSFRS